MEQKIKNYIETVFRDVPNNERTQNIKTEILQNLLDKYHDLRSEGHDEEEAYALALSSGGDLSGIVADLKGEPTEYNYNYEKQFEKHYEKQYKREKKRCDNFASWYWPLVVCVYLVVSFCLRHVWGYSWIIFPAAAAGNDLYRFCVIKSNRRQRRSALSSLVWLCTVTFYFILSFWTGRWDVTWLMYILAIPVSRLLQAIVFPEEDVDPDDVNEKEKKS